MTTKQRSTVIGDQLILIGSNLKAVGQYLPASKMKEFENVLNSAPLVEFKPSGNEGTVGDQLILIGSNVKAVGQYLPANKLNDFDKVLNASPLSEFLPRGIEMATIASQPKQPQQLNEPVQTSVSSPRSFKNVVIIGATGTGKSALGNLLCYPESPFKYSNSAHSVTKQHQTHVSNANGLQITDTAGFLDTEMSLDETKESAISAVNQLRDGIDAVLFVAKFGRITSVEYDALKLVINMVFGEGVGANLVTVLTYVSTPQLVKSRQDQQAYLKDQLKAGNEKFNELYKICGGRVVFVDNPPVDEDAEAESLNKKLREASRQNLLDAINSVAAPRYMPELAREARAKYGERQRQLQEELARAKTESERKLKEAAIAEHQKAVELEIKQKLDESFQRQQSAIAEMQNRILQFERERARNGPLNRLGEFAVGTADRFLNKALGTGEKMADKMTDKAIEAASSAIGSSTCSLM